MKTIVLVIMDGWGLSNNFSGNAIFMSGARNFNTLWRNYPHLALRSVFYKTKKPGILANSEVGHMMIGCGREIYADCEVIDNCLGDPSFLNNPVLTLSVDYANRFNSNIHIIGMASEGYIHSSLSHIKNLINYYSNKHFNRLYLHLITDGRDVVKDSSPAYINALNDDIEKGKAKIASICGRFYAMDRDNHFDRTEKYFSLITGNRVYNKALDARQAVLKYKNRGIDDQIIPPTTIYNDSYPVGNIKDNDVVIFTNFRSDRMRQLFLSLSGVKRYGMTNRTPRNLALFSFLPYRFHEYMNSNCQPIFPIEPLKNTLTEIITNNYGRVLKIAESDKLAHVTYFFNGGVDQPYKNEDRRIFNSIDNQDFVAQPEMSAEKITNEIIGNAKSGNYSLIVANYANVDELAHTGNIEATTKAVEVVDQAIKKLEAAAINNNFSLMITADHGHAESMITKYADQVDSLHTINPVPLIYIDKAVDSNQAAKSSPPNLIEEIAHSQYSTKDIAPTILDLLSIQTPKEMDGTSFKNEITGLSHRSPNFSLSGLDISNKPDPSPTR